MRPIGLYLAEFRPDSPASGVELPLRPDLRGEPDVPALAAADFDAMPDFEADAPPSFGEAESDAGSYDAPAEPAPDLTAALAALQAEHEATLAAARAQWAAEEGTVLAGRIDQAFADLETRLGDALAPLLEPFLAKAVRIKALAQLHDTLGTLLGGGETRAVTVSGPADLLAALREGVGDRPGVAFAASDGPDVTVALGDTRIRSQLRAWARKLDTALGASA